MDFQSNGLLQHFQRDRHTNFQLSDIANHIQELAVDMNGSKFIIQKLRDTTERRKELIYQELKPAMFLLMKDKYASLVIQRFYEIATTKQREEIIHFIGRRFSELSYDQYGCRMVQFVIEKSDFHVHSLILALILGNVVSFAKHRHAHFILIECFKYISDKNDLNFIADELAGCVVELCKDPYGCRIIQEIFENGNGQQCQRIVVEMIPQMLTLLTDRYGNFTIKVMLMKWPILISLQNQRVLINQFWELSTDKYASNSTEVMLEKFSPAQIDEIFTKLLAHKEFVRLCVHRFANYPIQKLIEMLNGEQKMAFFQRLFPLQDYLCNYKGGERVFTALLRSLNA